MRLPYQQKTHPRRLRACFSRTSCVLPRHTPAQRPLIAAKLRPAHRWRFMRRARRRLNICLRRRFTAGGTIYFSPRHATRAHASHALHRRRHKGLIYQARASLRRYIRQAAAIFRPGAITPYANAPSPPTAASTSTIRGQLLATIMDIFINAFYLISSRPSDAAFGRPH